MIKALFIGGGLGIAASAIGHWFGDSYPSHSIDIGFTAGVLAAWLAITLVSEVRQ